MAKKNSVPDVKVALSKSSDLLNLEYSRCMGGVSDIFKNTFAKIVITVFIWRS